MPERPDEPATTAFPVSRFDDPAHNPIAFLPTGEETTPIPVQHEYRTFTQADGSTYQQVSPDEFPSFDDVDSRTIVDDGAPD